MLRKHQAASPPSVRERIDDVVDDQLHVTSAPTQTQRDVLAETESRFTALHAQLRTLIEDVQALERRMEDAGAPWTPGRLPDWAPR